MTQASTSLDTRHGRVEVEWEQVGEEFAVTVSLPDGVTGRLDVSDEAPIELGSGRSQYRIPTSLR